MIEFANRKTGEKINCEFRVIGSNDLELLNAFQECVQEEYGGTYLRPEIYNAELLSKEIIQKKILCYLAISESGQAVSTLALTPYSGLDGVLEMGTHVVRKCYRGYGIGTVFTKALLELPETKQCCAVAAHSVTCHPLAQHQTISCGLIPTGFLFSLYSNEVLKPAYDEGGSEKQSIAVGIYPVGKRNAGVLYVPSYHEDFIVEIYNNLGIDFSVQIGVKPFGETIMRVSQDDVHYTKTIHIFHCGADLETLLEKELKMPHHHEQVINVLLDMNDSASAEGYGIIRDMGFIFTGVHPLCGNGEFIIMHNSMDIPIPFEQFVLDEGYKKLFDYVCEQTQVKH